MDIKFIGHSSFIIYTNGFTVLIDPFISGNPAAKDVDIKEINPDLILVSHGHQDHILDVEEIANQSKAEVVTNFEVANWLSQKGVEKCKAMNHGGIHVFEQGTVKMVPAQHSSGLPDGSYGGNPLGFIIKIEDQTIYYAGDTGLSMEMELIGRYEEPTIAILPIGGTFTMGVDDAIRCLDMVKCKKAIGMHYDSFPPIVIDKEESKRKFAAMNKELILMDVNESLTL